ncbi:mitochondrial ribosomal protein S13 [Haematococcus lacustris]
MVQIARVTLEQNRHFAHALAKIFGIGSATGLEIAEACGISRNLRVRDIKEPHLQRVSQYIQDHFVVEDQLKRGIRENILRLMNIKCRRGTRHELGLPIAGQTKSNSATARKLKHHVMYDTSR